jgi:hypothetical protein
MKLINKAVITIALVLSASAIQAKEYMGINVGAVKASQIDLALKEAGANYSPKFSYRGYRELTIYKVNSYKAFGKHGRVNEAWLHFTPKNVLYKFEVTYSDSGQVYAKFKDALNSKYQQLKSSRSGFVSTTNYKDGDVKITLTRNEFGFGNSQKTTIEYAHSPSLNYIQNLQTLIDEAIVEENAKKAGDL